MRIKLFEEYNELDFSKYEIISANEHGKYLKGNLIELLDRELKKIEKLAILSKYCNNNIYVVTLINNVNKCDTIDLIKLPDDYYVIDFLYLGNRYFIKCDQLQELLRLISYMSNLKNLDFNKFKQLNVTEHLKLIRNNKGILLSEYEIKKVKKLANVYRHPLKRNNYYNLLLSNKNYDCNNVELIKLDDDYYSISFFYKEVKYYIKCDQLLELIKLLKYMSGI